MSSDFRDEIGDAEPFDVEDPEHAAKVQSAIALLEDGPGIDDRALGVSRLGQLRERRELVESAARSKSPKLRAAAAVALGNFPHRPTGPDLLRSLAADEAPQVRGSAAVGIGHAGRTDLLDLLLDIASDPAERPVVASKALIAAARVADTAERRREVLAALLEAEKSGAIRDDSLFVCLGVLDLPEVTEELELRVGALMSTGNVPEPTARSAVMALGRKAELSTRGRELVVAALDALPGARGVAARILVTHPDERARGSLERLLTDPSPRLAASVVKALGAIGLAPSLEALEVVLARDDSTGERLASGLASVPESAELLVRTARVGPFHRAAAISALAQADPTLARSVSLELLEDPNPKVRVAAWQTAVRTAENEAELLRLSDRLAEEPVEWVRVAVTASLARAADGRPTPSV